MCVGKVELEMEGKVEDDRVGALMSGETPWSCEFEGLCRARFHAN